MSVIFTVEDLRTPERLERVLRQFNRAINESARETTAAPAMPDLNRLAALLAPQLRTQLQSPGDFPLNLQSLLPSQGLGVVLEGTHAQRLTIYPASSYTPGALYYETDRTVLYVVIDLFGVLTWQYLAGLWATSHAGRPTDLSANDVGFLLWITTQNHKFRWGAGGWAFIDDEGGYICDRVAAPTSNGWQLCDGTATDYLALLAGDIVVTAFTTPDENSGAAGVYHKSIAAYTGTINAAVAPVFTGASATLTGSVSAPTFTGNAATLTGSVAAPIFTGTLQSTGVPSATTVVDNTGLGTTVAVGSSTHFHNYTPFGTNNAPALTMDSYTPTGSNSAPTLTMNAYVPAGTIDATAQPRNMGVLRFFRR